MSVTRNGAPPDSAGDVRGVSVAMVVAVGAGRGDPDAGRWATAAWSGDAGVVAAGRWAGAVLAGAAARGGVTGPLAVAAGDVVRADAAPAGADARVGENRRDGGVTVGARNACNGGGLPACGGELTSAPVAGVAPAAGGAPVLDTPGARWAPFRGWFRFLLRDDFADMGVTSGSSRCR